ncbi:MAG: MCE family protein [Ignavibacteriales bacterium]|nr:MAG: MCE family protein [Ignavibacteriales bacterium]
MKDQRKTEIKVGVTFLLAIIIFLWVLGWAKNWSFNSNRKEISVEFSSVAGLEVNDPVTINGVRKGYVEDIIINGSKVITLLNLPSDIIIKEDAKFSVMMLDLMGGKKVEVNPGASINELDYKKLQQGNYEGDIASAMSMLGSVQNDLVDVIKEVKISITALNKTITDEKFTSDLKTSVANLSKLTDNLNRLVINNKDELNQLLKSGNELTKNVNGFLETNRDTLTLTINSVHDVLKTSKEVLIKINDFMDKTNTNQNNLGKLLNDSGLMNDLKATIQQAKDLTKILIDQLKSKGVEVNAHIF